jgi:ketosteroid isomerase-like protein
MRQAPPRQNVEIVRRAYEHFRETGEVGTEFTHPDFVWDMSNYTGWPEQQIYPGVDGANRFISEWRDAWDDWEWEVKSLHEGGDKVVAILHQAGCSKSTGIRVEMDFAQLFTLEGGRQVRMQMYADPQEALAAAGLTR